MKRNILLIGIVLATLLIVIGSVIAQENVAEQYPSSLTMFWNNLLHSLNLEVFSVVGENRVCSGTTPDKTWVLQSGQSLSSADSLASNTCGSGGGLYDFFTNGWTPYVEERNILSYACGTGPCNIELYCCPNAEPTSQSNCPSGTTFTPITCPSWSGTSFYKCPGEERIPYSRPSYNYCALSSSQTKTCYYKSGSTCYSNTYANSEFPNSCESYTYNSLPLYSTQSACLSSICVPLWQTTAWSTCSGGTQTRTVTDSNSCGVNTNKPTTSQSCGEPDAGNGDGNGNGDANIEVTNIVLPKSPTGTTTDPATREYSFKVTLNNKGLEIATINVEAGFYTYNYAKDVAKLFSVYPTFAVVNPIVNCVGKEPFLSTVSVELKSGETKTVEIKQAPLNAYVTLPISTYVLKDIKLTSFLGVYKTCCQKLPGFEGCVEGTGGYIDSKYDPGFSIPEQYATGSDEITCDAKIYGKIDWNFIESDKVMILEDYHKCISYTFHTEKGEINETATAANIFKLQDIKKLSLTKSEISKATSQDLLSSSCLSSSECGAVVNKSEKYAISCVSITKLREEGVITQATQDNFFENVGTIVRGTSYGAAGGVLACGVGWATAGFLVGGPAGSVVSVISLLANPATLGGCAAIGGLLGGVGTSVYLDAAQDDALLKELEAKNADAVGICVIEPKSTISQYFDWAAWSDITGDGIKDGTDGLIIISIGGAILLLILFMRK